MDRNFLSQEQSASFENDGFLVLPDFVSDQECDRLVDEANQLVECFDPGPEITIFSSRDQTRQTNRYFFDSADGIHFFFEPDAFTPDNLLKQSKSLSINKMGHALHDLNPVFDAFSRTKKISELCLSMGLEVPLLIQSMYIFKQPRIGAEVLSHQDATFLYTHPNSVIGLWFALQDATATNGCLYALPGGHRLGLKRRMVREGEDSVRFEELDSTALPTEGFVPLEVKKGSLLVLHGLLPHRSGPNESDRSRHAYTLHVIDGKTQYPSGNWLQRNMPPRGF